MNKIVLHGNLTNDVKIENAGEVSYARFSVASDRSKQKNAKTDFFRCVIFDAADLDDLTKGTFVKVTGTVRLGQHDGKPTIEVVAKTIERPVSKEAQA